MKTLDKTETIKTFSERLRHLRNVIMKMSQKEFAELIGISQPALSSYESGKINPAVDVVLEISQKCHVSLDWLFGNDSPVSLTNLGDVFSCFVELFETNEFSIQTKIQDRVDLEDYYSNDDKERNYVELKIYHNENFRNPECTLNMALAQAVTKAYKMTEELKLYMRPQETYDRDKAFYINDMSKTPITKIDHSGLSDEERRKKMVEIIERELKEKENKA